MIYLSVTFDFYYHFSAFSNFLFLDDGHDSKEDALACLDIMKLKVTADVSKLQSQVRANNSSKRRDAFLTDPDNVKLN